MPNTQTQPAENKISSLDKYEKARSEYLKSSENPSFFSSLADSLANRRGNLGMVVDAFVDTNKEKRGRAEEAYLDYSREQGIEDKAISREAAKTRLAIGKLSLDAMGEQKDYRRASNKMNLESKEMALESQKMGLKLKRDAFTKNQVYNKTFDQLKASAPEMTDSQIKEAMQTPSIQRVTAFDTGAKAFMQDGKDSRLFASALASMGGVYNPATNTVSLPDKGMEFELNPGTFNTISSALYKEAADNFKAQRQMVNWSDNYHGQAMNELALPLAKSMDGDYKKGLEYAEKFQKTLNGSEWRQHLLTNAIGGFLEDGRVTPEEQAQIKILGDAQGFTQVIDQQGNVLVQKVGADGKTSGKAVPLKDFYKYMQGKDTVPNKKDEFFKATVDGYVSNKFVEQRDLFDSHYGTNLTKYPISEQRSIMTKIENAKKVADEAYSVSGDPMKAARAYKMAAEKMGLKGSDQIPNLYGGIEESIKALRHRDRIAEYEKLIGSATTESQKKTYKSKIKNLTDKIAQLNAKRKNKDEGMTKESKTSRDKTIMKFIKNKPTDLSEIRHTKERPVIRDMWGNELNTVI